MGWEAALGSAIGGIAGAAANVWSTARTNRTNKRIANANNELSIELANSAHQREVADLEAAGLNPILSAGGTGAATPALQQAEMKAPQFDTYAVTDAIRAVTEAKKNNAETENINQDTKNKTTVQDINKTTLKIAKIEKDIKEATSGTEIQKKKVELQQAEQELEKLYYETGKTAAERNRQNIENRKLDALLDSQINNYNATAAFNKRRASGFSKGRNYGGGLNFHKDKEGWGFGINGNYGHNDSW